MSYLFTKVGQIFSDFWSTLKNITLSKKLLWLLLTILVENLGYFLFLYLVKLAVPPIETCMNYGMEI